MDVEGEFFHVWVGIMKKAHRVPSVARYTPWRTKPENFARGFLPAMQTCAFYGATNGKREVFIDFSGPERITDTPRSL